MKVLFFCALLLLFSCQTQKQKVVKRRVENKLIETIFVNDSSYDGITKYYSLSGILESKINFKNGNKDGVCINYYPNGKINDSMNFYKGYQNGYHYLYDSIGNLDYIDFFFFGKRVGEKRFYKKNRVSEYDFNSFDGILLYKADYDSVGTIQEFGGKIINLNTSSLISDNVTKCKLSLYLINPPNVGITYSLGTIDTITKEKKLSYYFSKSNRMFVDTILSPPLNGTNYFINADYFDSLNNFHKVHIQPFEFPS